MFALDSITVTNGHCRSLDQLPEYARNTQVPAEGDDQQSFQAKLFEVGDEKSLYIDFEDSYGGFILSQSWTPFHLISGSQLPGNPHDHSLDSEQGHFLAVVLHEAHADQPFRAEASITTSWHSGPMCLRFWLNINASVEVEVHIQNEETQTWKFVEPENRWYGYEIDFRVHGVRKINFVVWSLGQTNGFVGIDDVFLLYRMCHVRADMWDNNGAWQPVMEAVKTSPINHPEESNSIQGKERLKVIMVNPWDDKSIRRVSAMEPIWQLPYGPAVYSSTKLRLTDQTTALCFTLGYRTFYGKSKQIILMVGFGSQAQLLSLEAMSLKATTKWHDFQGTIPLKELRQVYQDRFMKEGTSASVLNEVVVYFVMSRDGFLNGLEMDNFAVQPEACAYHAEMFLCDPLHPIDLQKRLDINHC